MLKTITITQEKIPFRIKTPKGIVTILKPGTYKLNISPKSKTT